MRTVKTFIELMLVLLASFLIANTFSPIGESVSVEPFTGRLKHLFFLPNSPLILGDFSHREEVAIRVWSLNDGKLTKSIRLGPKEGVESLAVSHDGDMVAVATFLTETVGCYSLKENKWLWKSKWVERSPFTAKKVLFLQGDRAIVAFGQKQYVIYDAKKGEITVTKAKPLDEYAALGVCGRFYAPSPSGRYIMVWQGLCNPGHGVLKRFLFLNRKATIWDFQKDEPVARWERTHEICAAAFSPDEKEIVIGSCDGHVSVRSLSDEKITRSWRAHTNAKYPDSNLQLTAMVFSNDGRFLATYGDWEDGWDGVKVWDYCEGKLVHGFNKVHGPSFGDEATYPMAFSPDGKYFALEQQGNLCLYDTQTWQEKWCVPSWEEGK